MSKRPPRFTDDDHVKILSAKVDLAISLEEWINDRAPAARVVNSVEVLMLAVKILKAPAPRCGTENG